MGYLRLFAAGGAIPFTTLPKTQPLFVYLLLHRQEVVARDSLAFLLWDDVPESEARTNLRRHLHDLNKALPPGSGRYALAAACRTRAPVEPSRPILAGRGRV